MVVVLILGTLLAIGLPTFSDYVEATTTALEVSEPSLTYVDAGAPSTDARTVSLDAADEDTFTAAVWSESGT